jgi:hypothetical protein
MHKSLFRSRRGSQDNILHSPARSLGEESGGEDREEDDPHHLRVLSLERGCGDGGTTRKERTTSVDKKTSLRPIQEKRSSERPTEEAGEERTTSVDKKSSLRPIQEKRSRERPTEEAGEERTTSEDKKTSLRPIQEKRGRERPTEEAGEEGMTSVEKKSSLRPIQEKRGRERQNEEAGEERKGVDLCYNVSVTVNNRYMSRKRIDFFLAEECLRYLDATQ